MFGSGLVLVIEREHEHEHEKQPEQTHASKWPVGCSPF
jgi:hypothetical protein